MKRSREVEHELMARERALRAFLKTLGPEEEHRPMKYEAAFYAGWGAARVAQEGGYFKGTIPVTCVECGLTTHERLRDPKSRVRSGIGKGANNANQGTCRDRQACAKRREENGS